MSYGLYIMSIETQGKKIARHRNHTYSSAPSLPGPGLIFVRTSHRQGAVDQNRSIVAISDHARTSPREAVPDPDQFPPDIMALSQLVCSPVAPPTPSVD